MDNALQATPLGVCGRQETVLQVCLCATILVCVFAYTLAFVRTESVNALVLQLHRNLAVHFRRRSYYFLVRL